jgi:hypothetical protein
MTGAGGVVQSLLPQHCWQALTVGQYFTPPAVQPQVLAVHVKSAALVPQSEGALQQLPPPFEVYVHDDWVHARFWQPLAAGQSVRTVAMVQQPAPVVATLKQLPLTMLHASLVHALPSSQSVLPPQQPGVRAAWQLWFTQLTVMHEPDGWTQSPSPAHDESACARDPTTGGGVVPVQAASSTAASANLRCMRRPS